MFLVLTVVGNWAKVSKRETVKRADTVDHRRCVRVSFRREEAGTLTGSLTGPSYRPF